jgi:hypothetical protein
MESIARNVKDIAPDDRRSLEHVVGRRLQDNQRIIVQVVSMDLQEAEQRARQSPKSSASVSLPDYCDVYDGLSDEELTELESLILDRSPSRSSS